MVPAAIGTALALVVVTTLLGLLWRARTGRVRALPAAATALVDLAALGIDAPPGRALTLLQLSTERCAACRPTARLLGGVAAATPGAAHVEVRIDERPALVERFDVLTTPTTLLIDGAGVLRGRIAGAPKPAELRSAVTRILEESRAVS